MSKSTTLTHTQKGDQRKETQTPTTQIERSTVVQSVYVVVEQEGMAKGPKG